MKITWDDLKIDFSNINSETLLESWNWLIGNDKKLILISSIGDAFLEDKNGVCYWLNVGEGIIAKVAENKEELKTKLTDKEIVAEWFLVELVAELKKSGIELTENNLYGYKKYPILGGEYLLENFELTDFEVHFEISGQIYKQVKDLPIGTKINKIEIK
ncbi:T6SS immunity protein Tdi1 domain-containing protein [Flavobacterium sp.]|uniref:T6SS immunity protein Tdi1 domain-containing protein n=1 Tax=Flavobacterium sp. TaxID=239 RepID=UPI0038FCAA45